MRIRSILTSTVVLLLIFNSCGSVKKENVQIIGIAYNAKLGAVVESKDDGIPYYLDGLKEWPDSIHKKTVIVKGQLQFEKHQKYSNNDTTIVAGGVVGGKKKIILKPIWRLID